MDLHRVVLQLGDPGPARICRPGCRADTFAAGAGVRDAGHGQAVGSGLVDIAASGRCTGLYRRTPGPRLCDLRPGELPGHLLDRAAVAAADPLEQSGTPRCSRAAGAGISRGSGPADPPGDGGGRRTGPAVDLLRPDAGLPAAAVAAARADRRRGRRGTAVLPGLADGLLRAAVPEPRGCRGCGWRQRGAGAPPPPG